MLTKRQLLSLLWIPLFIAYICTSTNTISWMQLICLPFVLQLLVSIVIHNVSPKRAELATNLRSYKDKPYYQKENEIEKQHHYVRHHYTTTTTNKKYIIVTPKKTSKKCVVWVPGFGRYFSHVSLSSQNIFGTDVDLCGLDLPYYGRSYMQTGGHRDLNNSYNNVPPTSCWDSFKRIFRCATYMRTSYYYDVYSETTQHLKNELGYDEIYFMCNSTSGLTMQCYIEEMYRNRKQNNNSNQNDAIDGLIFTAPFWWPTGKGLPLLNSPLFQLLNVIAFLYPSHMMMQDGINQTWLSDGLDKAYASGRTNISLDPVLNPVDNTPYYVEWLAMASEGQYYLSLLVQQLKGKEGKEGKEGQHGKENKMKLNRWNDEGNNNEGRPRAMLLTNNGTDHNVNVDVVHDFFKVLYPTKKMGDDDCRYRYRIAFANHEMMLSEKIQFEKACKCIRKFLIDGKKL